LNELGKLFFVPRLEDAVQNRASTIMQHLFQKQLHTANATISKCLKKRIESDLTTTHSFQRDEYKPFITSFTQCHLNIILTYTLIEVNMEIASINFIKQTGEGALSSSH